MAEEKFRDIEELDYDNIEYEPTHDELGIPEQVEKQEKKRQVDNEKPNERQERKESQKVSERKPVIRKVKKKVIVKKSLRRSTPKPRNESNGSGWTYAIAIILGVIVIAAIVYFVFFNKPVEQKQADTAAVLVNGQPVYNSELDAKLNFVRATTNPFVTKEDVLNQTIDEMLLMEEAKKQGYIISDSEISEAIQQVLLRNNWTQEQISADLQQKGTNFSELVSFYKTRLTIVRLLNSTIVSKIFTSEKELKDFYDANEVEFEIPARVQIRHILIATINNSDNQTYELAKEVSKMINKDRKNFCDLVVNYTDDAGSISFCGEYNFSKQDPLVQEFLDAGFNMTPGEVRTVKTQFGYHIMYKVSDIEGGLTPYKETKDFINETIFNQKTLDAYTVFIEGLRSKAIIEIYSETKPYVPVSEPSISVPEVENLSAPPVQETPIKTEESPAVVKETVVTDESKTVSLAKCLANKGARLYQTYWCPDCILQDELFGDSITYFNVLECDAEAKINQAEQCKTDKVTTYPTWFIDGKYYNGMLSLRKLATLSGCTY